MELVLALRAQRKSIVKHWKTHEQIVCVGSYETRVVEWLNLNKMEFEWKPKTFLLPSGRKYTPDLFLIDRQLYIEIKGWWWNSKTYFDEFVDANMGKIELWNKAKLKTMKLLK